MACPLNNTAHCAKATGVLLTFLGAVFVTVAICSSNIPWTYMEASTDTTEYRYYVGLYNMRLCSREVGSLAQQYDFMSCSTEMVTGVFEDAGEVALGLTLAGITIAYLTSTISGFALHHGCMSSTAWIGISIFQTLSSSAFYIAALGHHHEETKSEYDNKYDHFARSNGVILGWIGVGLQFAALFPLVWAFVKHIKNPNGEAAGCCNTACGDVSQISPACQCPATGCPQAAAKPACGARAAAPAAPQGNMQNLANFSLLLATGSTVTQV